MLAAFLVEYILSFFINHGEMDMEGISILSIKRLGHEGGVKVVLCCYLLGHIIEKHGPISSP